MCMSDNKTRHGKSPEVLSLIDDKARKICENYGHKDELTGIY